MCKAASGGSCDEDYTRNQIGQYRTLGYHHCLELYLICASLSGRHISCAHAYQLRAQAKVGHHDVYYNNSHIEALPADHWLEPAQGQGYEVLGWGWAGRLERM